MAVRIRGLIGLFAIGASLRLMLTYASEPPKFVETRGVREVVGDFYPVYKGASEAQCRAGENDVLETVLLQEIRAAGAPDVEVKAQSRSFAELQSFEMRNVAGKNYLLYVIDRDQLRIEEGNRAVVAVVNRYTRDSSTCTHRSVSLETDFPDGRPEKKITLTLEGKRTEALFNPPALPLERIYSSASPPELDRIKAVSARKDRIKVAVIDIGVDYNHPALAYKLDRNDLGLDLADGDHFPYDFDPENGFLPTHGTAMADIAARGSNDILIIPVKHPSGRNPGSLKLWYDAIAYAHSRGARIINMSLRLGGGLDPTPVDHSFVENAIREFSDTLFVVSAGNSAVGFDIDKNPVYPASLRYPNLLTVASSGYFGVSNFSNFGKTSVHLAASAEDIEAAKVGGGTETGSGTSEAAALVSNAAARILAIRPELTVAEVVDILKSSVRKRADLQGKVAWGGELDLEAALAIAKKTARTK